MSRIAQYKTLFDELDPDQTTLEQQVLRDLIAMQEASDKSINALSAEVKSLGEKIKADRQNLDEVDGSVRQTWEALDRRVKALEQG